ncbi:sulfatase [Botryobacter ruber]|uniref:sulfatase n=1 Tax=Botryobacter ruber TaxID=2171629 RepID=UPI000E0C6FA9|nr:sulfatase [Botryobacter ruber]
MIKRIAHILPFLLLLTGLAQAAFRGAPDTQAPPQKPNVLFIVVDDMNMWSLLKDYPVLKVPAIEKLVSQSYVFKNAVCAAPVCVPSRASFFSGKYPHHTGVYRNGPDVWNASGLLTEVEAMPELFKRNGYTTWGGGKTFHVKLPGTREKDMFDNQVFHGNYGPFETGRGHWMDIKPWEGPDTDFTDVVNADAATAFLGQQHKKPFFMYYGLYRPHSPYTAPKRFFDLYDGVKFPKPPGYVKNDLADVPPMGKDLSQGMQQLTRKGTSLEEAWQDYLKAYCANTSFADWNLGRVLEALDKSPYAANTIVVFASDNGFHTGTKDHWTKQTLWEQADVVPFLIRLPGGKAYTCPQTANMIDIYPTLVEYCGLTPPKQKLDGQSLVPVLHNPEYQWNRPGLTTFGENYSSVRSERYRYIRYPDGSEELYDHQTDPYEHHNVAAKAAMKPVIAELAKAIPGRFQKSVPYKNEDVAEKQAAPGAPKKKNASNRKKS